MLLRVLICNLLLASAISANKVLLSMFPAILFVGLRMLSAGIFMCIYSYKHSSRLRWKYIKEDFLALVGIALFTTYFPSILKAFGLKHMFSSKAALYGSIDPFVTALYAYMLWHEKLTWKKFLGIMIGFSGIALITITNTSPEIGWHAWSIFSYPELASLTCVFIGRCGWIMIRSLVRKERYTPLEVNGLSMVGSGSLALITATCLGQWNHISIPSIPLFTILFVYTVFIGNVIGYTLYASVIKHVNFTLVSLAGFTIPIFVSFIGWLFLHEPISMSFFVATAAVFAGLVVFYYDELKKDKGLIIR